MIKIIDHPLIKDKLTRLRKVSTDTNIFRSNLEEITQLMFYEITKELEVKEIKIDTPVQNNVIGYKIKDDILLVAILRAGLGMVDSIKKIMPNISIGHIGLSRDEKTLKPYKYYYKMPDINSDSIAIICDPMIATAGSGIVAVNLIKEQKPKKIIFVGILGCDYGINKLQNEHPDIDIYVAGCDKTLNEKGYISPGLGDAGDRIFGTLKGEKQSGK